MDTNKAAYWIAVGVLALGLTSEYRHGNFVAVHRVAEHAGSVLCRISTRAGQTWEVASLLTRGEGSSVDNLVAARDRAEMAADQAELLRDTVRAQVRDEIHARADVIRAQAEMRRAQIEQIRWRTQSQFHLANMSGRDITVVCPKTGARIVVRAGSDFADLSPDVEVEDSF